MYRIVALLALSAWAFTLASGLSESLAADRYINTSIEVVKEYDSNVLFTEKDKKGDFVIRIKPKIQVYNDSERTRVQFTSSMNGEKYVKNPDMDTIETDNALSITHAWTQKFSTSLSGFFRRDETLDALLESTGVVTSRQERISYGAELAASYTPSPTRELRGGVVGGFTDYPQGYYPDQQFIQAYLDHSWRLTPRATVGVLVGGSLIDYKDEATNDTVHGTIYGRYDWDQTTTLEAGVGGRFTWLEQHVPSSTPTVKLVDDDLIFVYPVVTEDSSDPGLLFNAGITKNWTPRFSSSLQVGREQYNSADVVSAERNFVRTVFNYKYSDYASMGLRLGYNLNIEESSADTDKTRYLTTASWLRWRLSETLTAGLGGSYEYSVEDVGSADIDRDRYRLWVSITNEWPRLFENH